MTAPWRSLLASALHRNRSKPHSRYLQLATVTADGKPANRTVVFRGFLDNSDSLQFITDSRSQKITQLQHQADAEACWYFTKTREQFRFTGTVKIITAAESDFSLQSARQTIWKNISDAARSQFTWFYPVKPQVESALPTSSPNPNQPLDNFCLLLLTPHRVDHLELRGEPQNRCLYILQPDNSWWIQPINP
ncbi:MAG: Npun_F5749 family FMN-dependent PPOX-type flavoprotein [Pleurocapsa sp.]